MTNQTDTRREQARGNGVAQAGQFGHQAHSAPGAFDAGIDDTDAPPQQASAAVEVQLRCFGVPSNRHRNAQWFTVPGVLSAEAPVVPAEEVSRAVTITPSANGRREPERTFLTHEGALYTQIGSDFESALQHHTMVRNPYGREDNQEHPVVQETDLAEIQKDVAENWIVVDGAVLAREKHEPLLMAKPWGVSLESSYRANIDEKGFITDANVYTLTEWEKAQAASDRKRRRNGEENIGVCIDAGEGLAEFQTSYRRPPKLTYDMQSLRGSSDDVPVQTAAELVKMRADMAKIPGAVTRVDDGFGGTRPSIDWSLFSARQENDYRQLVRCAEKR